MLLSMRSDPGSIAMSRNLYGGAFAAILLIAPDAARAAAPRGPRGRGLGLAGGPPLRRLSPPPPPRPFFFKPFLPPPLRQARLPMERAHAGAARRGLRHAGRARRFRACGVRRILKLHS